MWSVGVNCRGEPRVLRVKQSPSCLTPAPPSTRTAVWPQGKDVMTTILEGAGALPWSKYTHAHALLLPALPELVFQAYRDHSLKWELGLQWLAFTKCLPYMF